MKIFIVHAHPGPRSFNAALKDTAIHQLQEQGHQVRVSDLYAMGLTAPPTQDDFTGELSTAGSLSIDLEQEHQFQHGGFAAEIEAEQAKVEWCDVLIFHFPIWWFSMPAVLKSWVERVMARGYAYGGGRKHDKGVFSGRLAMVCCTTGTPSSTYAENGVEGHVQNLLWPVNNGIFHYMGFAPLPPFVAFAPRNRTEEERQEILDAYAARLRNIASTKPLFMHPRGDYADTQRLLPNVAPSSGFQWHNHQEPSCSKAVPSLDDDQAYLA